MSTTFHFQFPELAGETLTVELRDAITNSLINTGGDAATDVSGWFTFIVNEDVPAGTYRIDALLGGVQQGAGEYVLVDGDATEFWANNYVANINRPLSTLATAAGIAAAQGVITTAIGDLHDFDPTSDTVSRVTLVDTCTTNADMRGTNNAVTSLTGVAQESTLVGGFSTIIEDTGTTIPGLIGSLHDLDSTAVQTAATAALVAYDPPTRAEVTADKEDVIAAVGTPLQEDDYTAAPSAEENASAVRSELTTELARLDAAVGTRLAPTTAGRTLNINADGTIDVSVEAEVSEESIRQAMGLEEGQRVATPEDFDVFQGTIGPPLIINPLAANDSRRTNGVHITLFTREQQAFPWPAVFSGVSEETPIDLSAITSKRLIVSTQNGRVLATYEDADISVTGVNKNIPRTNISPAITAVPGKILWTLWDVSAKAELSHGTGEVIYTP